MKRSGFEPRTSHSASVNHVSMPLIRGSAILLVSTKVDKKKKFKSARHFKKEIVGLKHDKCLCIFFYVSQVQRQAVQGCLAALLLKVRDPAPPASLPASSWPPYHRLR